MRMYDFFRDRRQSGVGVSLFLPGLPLGSSHTCSQGGTAFFFFFLYIFFPPCMWFGLRGYTRV